MEIQDESPMPERPLADLDQDYGHAVLHLAWDRHLETRQRTLLFGFVELLPAEIPPPIDDYDPQAGERLGGQSKHCIHVRHAVTSARRALDWYLDCRAGTAVLPENDGTLPAASEARKPLKLADLGEEPPWPALISASDDFYTEHRWNQLQRALDAERKDEGASPQPAASGASEGLEPGEIKLGTVGAVALDQRGHLAAGTSTGGMTNKRSGRVGDSPIIGAGTYASARCAVSATGHGELFIRHTVAHDICARLTYQGAPLDAAAAAVVKGVLVEARGDGGVIAMDAEGHVAMVFNTRSMYRGFVGPDGVPSVAVFDGPEARATR